MKKCNLKQASDACADEIPAKIEVDFHACCCEQPDEMAQSQFVPLPPTETGRRRHPAHQMKAPKFAHDAISNKTSEHTEMYFG